MDDIASPAPHCQPSWLYDEFRHAGVDYTDAGVAQAYDAQHQKFRDYEKDARLIIERLGLAKDAEVLDLGCGTGAFVLTAAKHCRKVHAADVSPAMLQHCAAKAKQAGLDNIVTHHAGFLTYEHSGAPLDAVVSVAALHHLPDFWKAVALKRIHDMLKPGGKFYLFDVVFSFDVQDYRAVVDGWVDALRQKAGDAMAEETIVHIRDEHSTFEWVMDGLLDRAGFRITEKHTDFPRCIAYVCVREG